MAVIVGNMREKERSNGRETNGGESNDLLDEKINQFFQRDVQS